MKAEGKGNWYRSGQDGASEGRRTTASGMSTFAGELSIEGVADFEGLNS
jgi:hypothetical protein